MSQLDTSHSIKRLRKVIARKRILDLLCLAVVSPVVVPVGFAIAVTVRVIDGKPVLFKQQRIGKNNEIFAINKFRTMRQGDGRNEDSVRITKLGGFLRKTSLDELPQLWNVLKGDMSLVGPRPLYPEYLPFYTEEEKLRHEVRPGITGLSQVSGRNNLRWTSRLAKDVEYVRNLSLLQDAKIIVKTIQKTLASDDVATVARDTGEPLDVERSYPRDSQFALRRVNILDVPYRVKWMNDSRTRKHMRISFIATNDATAEWYHRVKKDLTRDDFVVYQWADDEPVAMIGLTSTGNPHRGVLYMFVDPDRAGEGIGTASLKLLLDWVRTSHYDTVELSVRDDNVAAWRLYENLGFTRRADTQEHRRNYEFTVPNDSEINT